LKKKMNLISRIYHSIKTLVSKFGNN
jgi:hypothetical protein